MPAAAGHDEHEHEHELELESAANESLAVIFELEIVALIHFGGRDCESSRGSRRNGTLLKLRE